MKKTLALTVISVILSCTAFSQLMVSKLVGKDAGNSKLGGGIFTYLDFPIGGGDNQSLRLEIDATIGYLSIKAGYKYVFSETQQGIYIEPAAGYCRVVNSNNANPNAASYGDGIALALEAGYSLEVGQNENSINFGLKYESDQAGSIFVANSVAFRVSFSFHLLRRKN
jgi:hypothetical protein